MMKQAIVNLDRAVLNGFMGRLWHAYRARRIVHELNHALEYRFVVRYRKNNGSLLSRLCDAYGSDKGALKVSGHPYGAAPHTFADFYSQLFDHCRFGVTRVFECGLGTNNPGVPSNMGAGGRPGASLRVWKDYFPNAQIDGADIDRNILFTEDRIRTYHVDQTDPGSIARMWERIGPAEYDLMIDDGIHTFDGGICFFENAVGRLRSGGIYVIEDVSLLNLNRFRAYFADKAFQVDYANLVRPKLRLGDNSLVVIRKVGPAGNRATTSKPIG